MKVAIVSEGLKRFKLFVNTNNILQCCDVWYVCSTCAFVMFGMKVLAGKIRVNKPRRYHCTPAVTFYLS